jgi:hypothetical protein
MVLRILKLAQEATLSLRKAGKFLSAQSEHGAELLALRTPARNLSARFRMLSKCLNPHCSATFQYMDQGHLFRIDFNDAARKHIPVNRQKKANRSKTYPIEHFWLCQECSEAMTVALNDQGEVQLVLLKRPVLHPTAASVRQPLECYEAGAS